MLIQGRLQGEGSLPVSTLSAFGAEALAQGLPSTSLHDAEAGGGTETD